MRRHLKGRFKQRANNIQGDKIKAPLKYMKNQVKRRDELFIRFYQGSSNSWDLIKCQNIRLVCGNHCFSPAKWPWTELGNPVYDSLVKLIDDGLFWLSSVQCPKSSCIFISSICEMPVIKMVNELQLLVRSAHTENCQTKVLNNEDQLGSNIKIWADNSKTTKEVIYLELHVSPPKKKILRLSS